MVTLLRFPQLFQVLFLALHDWVPLGRLNDVAALHAADPPGRLLAVTLVSALPYPFGFAASRRATALPRTRCMSCCT
jgi:hypothetical protein